MSKALLVVEKDFDTAHVGVKRVIDFYEDFFSKEGLEITFATPRAHGLVALESLTKTTMKRKPLEDKTFPQFAGPGKQISEASLRPRKSRAKWSKRVVKSSDFQISLITNPWLVREFSDVILKQQFTFGIVYDVVPNLVSLGILNFGLWIDVAEFATAHSQGIEFFRANCTKTLAISESTKDDVLSLFPNIEPDSIEVLIPFESRASTIQRNWVPKKALNLLVVNGLDHRKNFKNACKAIELASKQAKIEVTFVGRERIAARELNEIFDTLTMSGVQVRWFREIDDAQLSGLFVQTDYLLFPSIYEGLGLPILEAQDHGVPAISSNGSSCIEINLNPQLTCDPFDWKALAALLVSVSLEQRTHLRGADLRGIQDEAIQAWSLKRDPLLNVGQQR